MTARRGTQRALAALLALCCAAALAGCKPRLSHNVSVIPDYNYLCTSYNGETTLDGVTKFSDIAANKIRLLVSPISNKGDAADVKISYLTEDGKRTVYGDNNLGVNTIRLGGNGKYEVVTGSGTLSGLGDIFFEVPEKKLSKGDTWTSVRFHDEFFYLYKHKFEFQQPVEYKYTYAGKEKLDGVKCARLKSVGTHQESTTMSLPEGEMTFITKLTRKGDIWFELKRGRVRKLTYDQIISYSADDAYTGEKVIEVNNTTRKTCVIIDK